jgi:methionyl-tRNA formyltransferase
VLKALIDSRHEVVGVVTQPDKPSGRGHKLLPTPVKVLAEEYGIPVYQFKRISKECDVLKDLNADIMITAAYGQILRQNVLDLTPKGVINIHASLLPKYRGSSPIQWCIVKGETETGVTIMKTDIGVDTGDMIIARSISIGEQETAGELFDRLSVLGQEVLLEALDLIENGQETYTKQDESKMSHYPMLDKDSGHISFDSSAQDIVNLCRGFNPWPVAYVNLDEMNRLKVYKASIAQGDFAAYNNGDIISCDSKNGLIVKCGDGAVSLDIIQSAGTKAMPAKDYLRGRKLAVASFK